jgi:hypothetical protein
MHSAKIQATAKAIPDFIQMDLDQLLKKAPVTVAFTK